MLHAGARYWAVTGTNESGQKIGHFFFVLLEPSGVDLSTIIVPYCTMRGAFVDRTCLLRAQDYPFLESDSFVDYQHADTASARDIERQLASDNARILDTVSRDLIRLILSGLLPSRHTKRRVKAWYQEFLWGQSLV